MRMLAAALVLGAMAGDPTPAGALKKLGEKKNYGFSIETKFEGDALAAAKQALETAVTGTWEKPDIVIAKAGKAAGLASKGGKTVYTIDGKLWDSAEGLAELIDDRSQAALRFLQAVRAPHAEWAVRLGQAASLTKLKEAEDECVVYVGPLPKATAKEMAESTVEPAQPAGDGVGRRRFGGAGGRLRPAERDGEIRVKEAQGTVKYLVSRDGELPRKMVVTVNADVTRQESGKPVESKLTITRTWSFEKIDESAAEIPEGAKGKLPK